jgi:hypothetical protein
MRQMKNRSRGLYLCFILLLALTFGGSVIAHADSGTGKATAIVNAGNLSESPAKTQQSLTLSKKKAQTASYSLAITVVDARGSGGGWNLMITSTWFSMAKSKGHLPAKASSISGVSFACGMLSTCTYPSNSIRYPLVIPANSTPPPPVKFFNANVRSGLGNFSLAMKVNVTIPSDAESGTYISTITLQIANGP